MSLANPVQREKRSVDLLATAGQTRFTTPFRMTSTADLRVYVRPTLTAPWSSAAGFTTTLQPSGLVDVDFAVAPAPTNPYVRLRSAQTRERLTDVTRGGVIKSSLIEQEFDTLATVLQEIRRDLDDMLAGEAAPVVQSFQDVPLTGFNGVRTDWLLPSDPGLRENVLVELSGMFVPVRDYSLVRVGALTYLRFADPPSADVLEGSARVGVAIGSQSIPDRSVRPEHLVEGLEDAFSLDNGPTPTIWRFSNRVLVGEAVKAPALDEPGVVKTWVGNLAGGFMAYYDILSQSYTIADRGRIAFAAATRTSDHVPTAGNPFTFAATSIAIAATAEADRIGLPGTAWVYYGTGAQRAGSTNSIHGMELNIANENATTVACHPYQTGATGTTVGGWFRSGGETSEVGIPVRPISAAIAVVQGNKPDPLNPGQTIPDPNASHERGLVFGRYALAGGDGLTGNGIAISAARGHEFEWLWYNPLANTVGRGAVIRSSVDSARTTLSTLEFTNDGPVLVGDVATLQAPLAGRASFRIGGVERAQVNQFALDLTNSTVLAVAGNPVIGPRRTGWTAGTGAQRRATFDTTTVTTQQLAELFLALQIDLLSHGVIGT